MIPVSKWETSRIAAQCIIAGVSSDNYYTDESYRQKALTLVDKGIGGFCVFAGDIAETSKMLAELQMKSEIPLIFAADFEHGLRMRLTEGTAFPHAMALGKTGKPEYTKRIASAIAKEAKSIGITWNLAPVCDINSNKKNPIINIRSFGEDQSTVSDHSAAYIEGTQAENVIACAKHFPGHGDTEVDSHLSLPVLNQTIEHIREYELKPFVNAVSANVQSVMIGHLAVPALDDAMMPASLSSKVINYLRNELKFSGIIITDALEMKSITLAYSTKEAALKAVEAGVNILLMPENTEEAIVALAEKADNDENTRNMLIASAGMLIKEKRWCGLFSPFKIDIYKTQTFFEHEKLALKVAHEAVKIDGNKSKLPIGVESFIAGFAIPQNDDLEPGAYFFKLLGQALENNCDFGFIDANIREDEIDSIIDGISEANLLIFAFFFKSRAYHGSVTLPERLNYIIKRIADGRDTILIFFGNPYIGEELEANTSIFTYSDSQSSIAAAVIELAGRNIEDYTG